MMKTFSITALAALLASAVAYGQSATAQRPVPPEGDLLAKAPAFSHWVVVLSSSHEQGTAPTPNDTPQIKSIETTKTGDIVWEQILTNKGQKFEEWHVGATQYKKVPDSQTWTQSGPADLTQSLGGTDYSPLPASGFRDLEWVGAQSYAGMAKYGSKNCLIFAPGVPPNLDLTDPAKLSALGTVAFIDFVTRLPFEVRRAGITYSYQFEAPPSEKLTLPDDLSQQITAGKEARVRLSQPAGRPY